MGEAKTVRNIVGTVNTGGTAEQNLALSLDGATGAGSIAVAAGTDLIISDLILAADERVNLWRLQQTNNGSDFFDIGLWELPSVSGGTSSRTYSYPMGFRINGGADVAFRMRVQTQVAGDRVHCTIRSYLES